MGPRQDAGEDESTAACFASRAASFNGAPAGCRGRHGIPFRNQPSSTQLQWGPGRMPGKTAGYRQWLGSVVRLQWGPGRMPGKTRGHHPSTGRRSELQWGPGRMPGKTTMGLPSHLATRKLQWGPGRMPGKTAGPWVCRPSAVPGFNGAPAGCRGRLKEIRRATRAGKSFNGAPAGCRGRPLSGVGIRSPAEMLQWGPGRMPGKTRIATALSNESLCFNGAPAGCRGRL